MAYEEPTSWNNVFSPALFVSVITTFVLSYIMPPILARTLFHEEKDPKLTIDKRKSLFTHAAAAFVHSLFATANCVYLIISGDLGDNLMYSNSSATFLLMQFTLGFYVTDMVVHLLDNNLRSYRPTFLLGA